MLAVETFLECYIKVVSKGKKKEQEKANSNVAERFFLLTETSAKESEYRPSILSKLMPGRPHFVAPFLLAPVLLE